MFEIDIKPSVLSWVTVGVMAITFIVVFKFVVNKWSNPVTDVFRPVVNIV